MLVASSNKICVSIRLFAMSKFLIPHTLFVCVLCSNRAERFLKQLEMLKENGFMTGFKFMIFSRSYDDSFASLKILYFLIKTLDSKEYIFI